MTSRNLLSLSFARSWEGLDANSVADCLEILIQLKSVVLGSLQWLDSSDLMLAAYSFFG